jgi:hypothetical protein
VEPLRATSSGGSGVSPRSHLHAQSELRALLASALDEEGVLLDRLRKIFLAQREALAANDPAALDDGVFAATRVLRTLDEARRRRQGLTAGLVGADVDFDELDAFLTGHSGRPIRVALERLREGAAALREEVGLLRRILQVALSDNRRYLDALLGDDARAGGYEPTRARDAATDGGGAVLDRMA